MNIQKMMEPFEHLIVDDVYTEDEMAQIWREIYFLKSKFQDPNDTVPAIIGGTVLKKNKALFIDDVYADRGFSDLLRVNRKVFTADVINAIAELHPAYGAVRSCNVDSTMINYYADGDYYKAHIDTSVFTFITFLVQEPQGFSGGDFLFPDFEYTVKQKNNRVVIFPGCIRHQVTKVKLNTPVSEGRFSMSQFLNMKG
jgi:hypothetical protein